jgi:uncharacterized protein with ACT and thioredoxin-like domain
MSTKIVEYGLIVVGVLAAFVPVIIGAVAEHRHHHLRSQRRAVQVLTREVHELRAQLEVAA